VRKKTYSSDTMLGICNLHYQGAKGHIYSTYTGRKYAENPLTNRENTIYNIHLTSRRCHRSVDIFDGLTFGVCLFDRDDLDSKFPVFFCFKREEHVACLISDFSGL
jgi:hypothetical protein